MILGALVARFGAEPFVEGLRRTSAGALLLALVVTAGTTWCCAWRWSLLAGGLDVAVPVRSAYAAYYRSQLLNATLPGGVVGDVHRAVRHGRESGALGRGLRSVAWDRGTGQVAQAALAVAAVPLLPGPVQVRVLALVAVVAAGGLLLLALLRRRYGAAARAEVRRVGAPGVWPRVAVASVLAAGGHVLVFVVAARTAGVTAPLPELVPLALVVLLASAVPLSIAGWGPREGAAAWLFGAAGLGAAAGVSVAVVYGVMSLVATLPGALVLLARSGPALAPGGPGPIEEPARG